MEKQKRAKIKGLEQGLIDVEKYLSTPGQCDCGGDFVYEGLGRYKCDHCGKIFENEYAIIRNFVDKHGTNYSILEISELTGVSRKFIDWFVRDGRFIPVEKQRTCMICHEPIASGFYCNRCALREQNREYEEKRNRNLMSGVRNPKMDAIMHYSKRENDYDSTRNNKTENKPEK